jgi:hypothetical protein
MSIDSLIDGLGSKDSQVRASAFQLLSERKDAETVHRIGELLDHSYGYVVDQALDLLCMNYSPGHVDRLERFVSEDRRFDLVWKAQHAIEVVRGQRNPGQPGVGDRQAAYSSKLILELLTWKNPACFEDALVLVVMPSFQPEFLIAVGDSEIRIRTAHAQIWSSISGGGPFEEGGFEYQLSLEDEVLNGFREAIELAIADGSEPGTSLDGISFGGFGIEEGIPRFLGDGSESLLLGFLEDVRGLVMSAVDDYEGFRSMRALGRYLDGGLECISLDFPIAAIDFSGRLQEKDWVEVAAVLTKNAPTLVFFDDELFISPELKSQLGARLESFNSVIIRDESNLYLNIAGLESRSYESPREAIQSLNKVPKVETIGYWKTTTGVGDQLPEASWFVEPNQDLYLGSSPLADLLDAGVEYVWCMGFSVCRICGRQNGCSQRTDGRFVWPDGLSHYVREHGLSLPPSIASELRRAPSHPAQRFLLANVIEGFEPSLDRWIMETQTGKA